MDVRNAPDSRSADILAEKERLGQMLEALEGDLDEKDARIESLRVRLQTLQHELRVARGDDLLREADETIASYEKTLADAKREAGIHDGHIPHFNVLKSKDILDCTVQIPTTPIGQFIPYTVRELIQRVQVLEKAHIRICESNERLRKEVRKLEEAPLCGDHAETWYTRRPSLGTKCILCEHAKLSSKLSARIEMLDRANEELKEACEKKGWELSDARNQLCDANNILSDISRLLDRKAHGE